MIAAALAAAALAVTAWHLVPPRLAISERTLAFARRHLVAPSQRDDFDFLAGQPCWQGRPVKALLEELELAGYNRGLVNWKVDDGLYREFVVSPIIGPSPKSEVQGPKSGHELHAFAGMPLWRRVLWESLYPRVRREQDPAAAAGVVVRYLRERVTLLAEVSDQWSVVSNQWRGQWQVASGPAGAWQRQISDERGFEGLYVAALRSVGVASRLGTEGRAELWTGSAWAAAPRPLVSGS